MRTIVFGGLYGFCIKHTIDELQGDVKRIAACKVLQWLFAVGNREGHLKRAGTPHPLKPKPPNLLLLGFRTETQLMQTSD